MEDWRLLRQYVEHGSEAAFTQLVERHQPLVHAICLRELGDPQLAEDVTQTVFLLLADKAHCLHRRGALSAWLFQTARLAAKNAHRRERRRQRREQELARAVSLHESPSPGDTLWESIEPHLHAALDSLSAHDREAVFLRLVDGKSLAETGAALGVSEDAARMRVTRALEKLRKHLGRHGPFVPGAMVAALLSARMAHSATALRPSAAPRQNHVSGQGSGPDHRLQGALREMGKRNLTAAASAAGLCLLGAAMLPMLTRAVTPITTPPQRSLFRPAVTTTSQSASPQAVEIKIRIMSAASAAQRETSRGAAGAAARMLMLLQRADANQVLTPTIATLLDMPAEISIAPASLQRKHGDGPSEKSDFPVETRLKATPHLNADGSLTVRLSVAQQNSTHKSGATFVRSMEMAGTLNSGDTILLGSVPLGPDRQSPSTTVPSRPSQTSTGQSVPPPYLVFVTATLLPTSGPVTPPPPGSVKPTPGV